MQLIQIFNIAPPKGTTMTQVLIIAHIVAFALACELIFTDEKDKKINAFLKFCIGALVICLVASMFIPLNF